MGEVVGVANDIAIHVEGLTFAYADGRAVLSDLKFGVATGETVGLIGPNGAGKTTLFLCLSGVLGCRRGTMSVAGLDPAVPADRRRLPEQVGLVFQNSDDQLFNATLFDDVAFGPLNLGLAPDEVRARVAEALAKVGLTGSERRVPFHLSGGEQRRAALAGVLAMHPNILLLDEPTMFLDPRARRDFTALLGTIAGTKMIATHDLEFVLATCTRAILLDAGKLIADGPTQELLANAELMDSHGLQVPPSLRSKSL